MCVDVYGVFVVVECSFFESACCLFCRWMKWVCGVRVVVSGCAGVVLVFRQASVVCLCLVCSLLRCV